MKSIRTLIFGIVLTISGIASTMAQDGDSEASELHLFRGGYLDVAFGLNLNTVGSSLGTGSMGGVISSRVENGALDVNLNPAHLTSLKKAYVAFDTRVGLGTTLTQGLHSSLLSTINDEIDTAVNDEFSNEDSWTQFPETYIKPTQIRGLDVGLRNEIASVAFAAPLSNRVTLAGSYHYPAAINFDFGLTGLSAKLAQEQGTDEVAIRFDVLMNISLLMKMDFRMSTLSLGGGGKLIDHPKNKLSLGATLTRYQLTNTRSLQADLSGMVVVGGADERYFNNPNDPNLNTELGESNAFFMNAYGEFEASAYGYKLGMHYQHKGVNVSMVYDYVPTFELLGTNKVASAHLPVFLVGSGDDILAGEIEVALDSLQANKPNLTTERNISALVDDGALQLPSSLLLGLDIAMGPHTMVLNYTKYLGELSFEHGGHIIGKETTHGVGIGFDFKMRDRFESWGQIATIPVRLLFLDIDGMLFQAFGKLTNYKNAHYRFGGNVMIGPGIATVNNSDLETALGMPLPHAFSMGRGYTIFDHIDVGVSVLAFPDMMLKYSVGIRF